MNRLQRLPGARQYFVTLNRSAAIRQWQRMKGRFAVLNEHEPVVSRIRSARGRRLRTSATRRASGSPQSSWARRPLTPASDRRSAARALARSAYSATATSS